MRHGRWRYSPWFPPLSAGIVYPGQLDLLESILTKALELVSAQRKVVVDHVVKILRGAPTLPDAEPAHESTEVPL